MDVKELTDLLVNASENNRCRYVPWWEDDFENCMYRYDLFREEEIKNVEACAAECGKETLLSPVGKYGFSPFHLLVWLNFYHAVETFMNDAKLDEKEINLTNGTGTTPLMMACCRGNLAMAELLLHHGADSGLCDANGRNGYHYLANPRLTGLQNGFQCLRSGLLQREPLARLLTGDINQKDAEGKSPLVSMLYAENANCSWALTSVFLEKGAAADYIDENGNTLLLTAIQKRHVTAALILMGKYSSMVNTANNEGQTPMQLAKDSYQEELCMALKDHGAEQPCDNVHTDMGNLSRITSNAFARFSPDERDFMGMALYLTRKLIRQIDPDDDDDMKYIIDIMHNGLSQDENCQVLTICQEAGIDFTAPIHSGGSVTCLRDKCLGAGYGVKVLRKFAELGVDLDEAVVQGKTPANIAAFHEKPNGFFKEAQNYFAEAAQYFSKESMEQLDNTGTSAIHSAARFGHADMLKVMIEKGVDVNLTEDAPAESGNTPLHTACIYGHGDVVKLLMASGADDSLQNINGETPAHLAVMKKKFGGDLQSKDRSAVLKELKTLDTARNDGMTPLMLLQSLDINTTVTLLPIFLDMGADVNHTDNRGNTALIHNTQNQCFKDIVKELVRAGADINIANNEGNTALHYALRYGNQDVSRYLVKKGADYNRANNQGVTPVQLAAERGYDTVLEVMTDIH